MAKQKKIGFGYYLDKRLSWKREGHFRVYAYVQFSRRNTKLPFPLIYGDGYLSENEFQQFFEDRKNPEINKQIECFESELSAIIRFEYEHLQDRFTLKGIAQRQNAYHRPLSDILEQYAKRMLKDLVAEHLPADKVAGAFDEAFWLSDSYYLLKDNLLPNLEDMLTDDLRRAITVEANMSNFDRSKFVDREYLKAIDWLRDNIRQAFKEFLLQGSHFQDAYRHESPESSAYRLHKAFSFEKLDAANYLKIIDKAIVEMTA